MPMMYSHMDRFGNFAISLAGRISKTRGLRSASIVLILAFVLATLIPNSSFTHIVYATDDVAKPKAYDYSIDEDGDGMPDELVAGMKKLRKLRKENADRDEIERTHQEMIDRLPYLPETYAAFEQLTTLYRQAENAKEPEAQLKLIEDVRQLLESMRNTDPAYALTVDTFEQLMPDRVVVDPQALQAATFDVAASFYNPLDGYGENGQLLNQDDGTQPKAELPGAGEHQLFLPLLSRNEDSSELSSAEVANASALLEPQAYGWHVYMSSIHVPKLADFSLLQRGDVMLKFGKGDKFPFLNYTKYYSHDALFSGLNQTYESNFAPTESNTVHGVRLLNLNRWSTDILGEPVPVAFLRSNDNNVRNQASSAVDWAINNYGSNGETGYNSYIGFWWDTNSNKYYEGYGFYCSQLAWKVYGHIGGTASDIDSDSADLKDYLIAKLGSTLGTHLAVNHVLPDEIYLDSHLTMNERGLNYFP